MQSPFIKYSLLLWLLELFCQTKNAFCHTLKKPYSRKTWKRLHSKCFKNNCDTPESQLQKKSNIIPRNGEFFVETWKNSKYAIKEIIPHLRLHLRIIFTKKKSKNSQYSWLFAIIAIKNAIFFKFYNQI